eukprot:gene11344-20705_t
MADKMKLTEQAENYIQGQQLHQLPRANFPRYGELQTWDTPAAVTFHPELIRPTRRTDPDPERRAAVEETIHARGPYHIQIWTDGSCKQGTEDGGAGGVLINTITGQRIRLSSPAGRKASSYKAEMVAIAKALKELPAEWL